MSRYVCIHGHFYQPPRENPWLEEVELQDGAYPYHDWNERITAECYAPNASSRILGHNKKIVDIVNNYAKISFNFGPTLLSWVEKHSPELYRQIIDLDVESRKRFSGHGPAIAQVYNHMIMPLATPRNKLTQVIWGIKDFEYRFGRKPEGMWLPETAVDLETLDILASHGIKFTILAPRQASQVRPLDGGDWTDVSGGRIDPKMPYLVKLPSARKISVFFYDGPISNDVSFAGVLKDGEGFANRLMSAFSQDGSPQLVHIATDGETYGHHHTFGDMALAYCIHHIESRRLAKVTIYAEYLEKHPPAHEAEIFENTAWSCAHGVERWKSNCGCNTRGSGWTQEWRVYLREAMDWLSERVDEIFYKKASLFLKDPWAARDDYIEVILDRSEENISSFLSKHLIKSVPASERIRIMKLMEMERNCLLTFTSCGWFFDEISGIESVQVMYYAARTTQLAKDISGADLEPEFMKILGKAPSNIPEFGNGAKVYEVLVKPNVLDILRVGAHYAVSSLFEEYPKHVKLYAFTAGAEHFERVEQGRQKLAVGKAKVRSEITKEEETLSFAVVHFGDHNIHGGIKVSLKDENISKTAKEMKSAFKKEDIPAVMRLMKENFGSHNYSLWHLFKDEQRNVLGQILEKTLAGVEVSFREVYENNFAIMHVLRETGIPLPKAFFITLELILNLDLKREIMARDIDLERLGRVVSDIQKWAVDTDKNILSFVATERISGLMETLLKNPGDTQLASTIDGFIKVLGPLGLELNLWKAQNIYFKLQTGLYPSMADKGEKGDRAAASWTENFRKLGDCLYMNCEG